MLRIKSVHLLLPLLLSLSHLLNAELTWGKQIKELKLYSTDAPATTKFAYSNTSKDRPVNISNVKTDCGCTTAELDSEIIKPGETGEISVRFNPKGKTGIHEKKVTITTDDIQNPVTTLTVRANVITPVAVKPSVVFFSDHNLESSKSIAVTIEGSTGFKFIDMYSKNGNLELTQIASDESKYTINITLMNSEEFSRDLVYLKFQSPDGQGYTHLVHTLRK